MKSFEFYNPVRVLFGDEYVEKLADYIPPGKKVIIVYGGGSIKRNGVYNSVINALGSIPYIEFGGIEPNPSYEKCMEAVELIKREKAEFILAVGGGSVIDAAKFIGVAARYRGEDPWDILAKQVAPEDSLPLGALLTLPATGTEMNKNSVISRRSTTEKYAFVSPWSFPQFSILMPAAAGTLPPGQVANGVVDAFVHVIEQYLTYPVNAPVQDRIAESILKTLIEEGPKALANPADYPSMANLMWSATMALNGLISCGMPTDWSVHSIGHELTALHNIDHARTLAIVLPGMWSVLKEEKGDKLLQYASRVWGIEGDDRDEVIDRAIAETTRFFESLGIATRLPDYNVGRDTIDEIVSRFTLRGWMQMGDRNLVTPEVVRLVLESRL